MCPPQVLPFLPVHVCSELDLMLPAILLLVPNRKWVHVQVPGLERKVYFFKLILENILV